MNFSLPFTIILAAAMLVITTVEKKFFKPSEKPAALQPVQIALPADSVQSLPVVVEPPAGSGFRVQLFVSTTEEGAKKFQEQIKYLVPYPSHLFFENGEYKVRVGDFRSRSSADSLAALYRKSEYPDAWVVESPIAVTKAGFRVQLASLKSLTSSAAYARMMEKNVAAPLYLIREEGMWKVRAGDFLLKEQAETFKTQLIGKGYGGIWVVEDRVYGE